MLIVDTDIMIDILRGYKPALEWLKSLKDEEILIPGFVVMELIQGCRNKREQNRIEKEILKHDILWPAGCPKTLLPLDGGGWVGVKAYVLQ